MIRFSVLLVIAVCFGFREASYSDTRTTEQKIRKLSEKYVESQNGKIKGYRVQIHFGAEKAKAMQIKSRFLSRYPEVRAYDPFDAPYFKIRVGDFRTKLEAYKFMKELIGEFPGSFIVADDIELPPL
ncbi:MAG: SPOR domain-containing protein [Bacteroidia bacterium]|nr:SPOR domain-containing protein [Bacteroidia bacterium]